MRQNAVFICNGHKVRRDADNKEVHQRDQMVEGDVIFLSIGLHKLEAYSAARQVIERIVAVLSLGVKHGHGLRKFVFRKVVVTYDHFDAFFSGIFHLFVCLDAAVKSDYESEIIFRSPVYAFV